MMFLYWHCQWQFPTATGGMSSNLSHHRWSRSKAAGVGRQILFASSTELVSNFKSNVQTHAQTARRIANDGVHVTRNKYIPVSKSELLDAILFMFESPEEKSEFLILSSCLDAILHAEHKRTLEEMRLDYDLTHSVGSKITNSICSDGKFTYNRNDLGFTEDMSVGFGEVETRADDAIGNDKPLPSGSALDSSCPLGSSINGAKRKNSLEESRVPVATRFQRSFVQLLYDAQFEELSAADLMLTSALNTNYLLTLPIYVDWKKASESKAIIFRRGYATERQKGRLIGEKLDYLQSKFLQGFLFFISKPLGKVGMRLSEVIDVIVDNWNLI